MNVSAYIRRQFLEKRIEPEPDLQRLRELRRLGRLLKQISIATQGTYSQEMVNTINGVESYAMKQTEKFKH